jgi:cation transport regulator
MPYRTNADLPTKQTDQYSTHGKTAFRKAFNSALSEYNGDEGSAFAVAHHAAQQAQAVKIHAPRVKKPSL